MSKTQHYPPREIAYLNAKRRLDKIGCSNATGDARQAMYASLLAQVHGGEAWRYYAYLELHSTDETLLAVSKVLLVDRAAAWDALMDTA